ncbi:helix-turn-helix transcriptional regulator [Flavobacterium sp. SUN052]|uniref:helix-turn-helix domain-containing protein n=1 Tax=Flavobacterium sp. SUN052 TaxID=3002441 RepID=UPI00237D357C|nr:helix-turn-helix transcriptional regulator [Flavobacterium sp. SUN052]MEC4003673.1 helix-turn-helix transcriptional regulator [Flavobacterium sp. SUN052]
MDTITIKEFYQDTFGGSCPDLEQLLSDNIHKNIGHFNVFNIKNMYGNCKTKPEMPYNKRTYYKVSLIAGENHVEYADRTIEIKEYGVLFATPKIPYRYTPITTEQAGHFCVFTKDFVPFSKTGFDIDSLPIFSNQSDFIYQISENQYHEINSVFEKMHLEIDSDYEFKYDLIRNYLMELIHYGQKLKPIIPTETGKTAASRITSLFIELLERQFPIENITQLLLLKTPKDYADALNVHVNHLNKVLKETIGRTTSEIVASRINQEAKILLKQTNWNVSEIAYSLGFEEVAHFSNFFKKHTNQSPLVFRE